MAYAPAVHRLYISDEHDGTDPCTPQSPASSTRLYVDHSSGKVAKVEQIKDGNDLSHARAKAGALAKTKQALRAATGKAEHGNPGYRTVSLTPASESKHAVDQVVLAKGEEMKTVLEALE